MLCLAIAGVVAMLNTSTFTLAWQHSIEKTAWQEDWQVQPDGLALLASRIKGSGAGMEPPEGSVLADGWYHYHPTVPKLPVLRLARSGAVADWMLCLPDGCKPLAGWLPQPVADTADATLSACSTHAAAAP